MRLVLFQPSNVDTTVQGLPEPDIVVDPRPISEGGWDNDKYKFEVTVNGTTLTITRINPPEDRDFDDVTIGWHETLKFRVYNSNEERYSFESTKYLYHALQYEKAPLDTTEVIIKDGAETIGEDAFCDCGSLVKVTIPDSVKRIEAYAFSGCESLRFIKLPPNLQRIGWMAFAGGCKSLEAVFLPPTVKQIGAGAFRECASLRILNIPDSVERSGRSYFMDDYESLMTDEMAPEATPEEQFEWLRNRYNPLHNLCCQPSVMPQAIAQHIQDNNNNEETARTNDRPQFTALHLLAANPSVTGDMVTAYLQLVPDVAVMQDDIRKTPLHMLCSLPHFSGGTTGSAIRAYLAFEKGREAAFMADSQGKRPFQYLCEKSFDEMSFLKEDNKSFGGLFCWWFDCLEINLFTGGADMKEISRKRKFSGSDDL